MRSFILIAAVGASLSAAGCAVRVHDQYPDRPVGHYHRYDGYRAAGPPPPPPPRYYGRDDRGYRHHHRYYP